jgi:hypothetical protein
LEDRPHVRDARVAPETSIEAEGDEDGDLEGQRYAGVGDRGREVGAAPHEALEPYRVRQKRQGCDQERIPHQEIAVTEARGDHAGCVLSWVASLTRTAAFLRRSAPLLRSRSVQRTRILLVVTPDRRSPPRRSWPVRRSARTRPGRGLFGGADNGLPRVSATDCLQLVLGNT